MSKWEEIIKEHFYSKERVEEKKRVCKKNIQIESCRACLMEALCHYEKMCKENKVWRGGSLGPE